jgi:hypothetical protein
MIKSFQLNGRKDNNKKKESTMQEHWALFLDMDIADMQIRPRGSKEEFAH